MYTIGSVLTTWPAEKIGQLWLYTPAVGDPFTGYFHIIGRAVYFLEHPCGRHADAGSFLPGSTFTCTEGPVTLPRPLVEVPPEKWAGCKWMWQRPRFGEDWAIATAKDLQFFGCPEDRVYPIRFTSTGVERLAWEEVLHGSV